MEFKRFLINKLILFFVLSTLITVAVSMIGTAFDGAASLNYRSLLTPVKYAALCMIPTLVTWSRRELSAKELFFRKLLTLILIEAEMQLIAFQSPVIDTGNIRVILALVGSVLVIFILTNLFLWLKDSAEAKRMNSDLERFQKLHG